MSSRLDEDSSAAILTPDQVAAELGVTGACVRRWLAEGKLDGVRLGDGPLARYRVARSALEEFVRRAAERLSRPDGGGRRSG